MDATQEKGGRTSLVSEELYCSEASLYESVRSAPGTSSQCSSQARASWSLISITYISFEVANLMPSAASMLQRPYTIFLPLCMARGLYVHREDKGLRRHFPVAILAIQASYLPSTSIFLKEYSSRFIVVSQYKACVLILQGVLSTFAEQGSHL